MLELLWEDVFVGVAEVFVLIPSGKAKDAL
jgi:hypothetical protein